MLVAARNFSRYLNACFFMRAYLLAIPLILAGFTAFALAQRRHTALRHHTAGKNAAVAAPIDEAAAPAPQVFTYVAQMPEFPGSVSGWLESHARPVAASGKVAVQFIVMADGTIAEPKVVRSAGAEADSEAVRLIRSMPKWKPARNQGVPVNLYYTLAVVLRGE